MLKENTQANSDRYATKRHMSRRSKYIRMNGSIGNCMTLCCVHAYIVKSHNLPLGQQQLIYDQFPLSRCSHYVVQICRLHVTPQQTK